MTINNLMFQLHSRDIDLMVLQVTAISERAAATQVYYSSHDDWQSFISAIRLYIDNPQKEMYIETGINMDATDELAFIMFLRPMDKHGKLRIDVDISIEPPFRDAPKDIIQTCSFYLYVEIGAVENMLKGLEKMPTYDAGTVVRLYEDDTMVLKRAESSINYP